MLAQQVCSAFTSALVTITVSFGLAAGDYHLAKDSPAVDAPGAPKEKRTASKWTTPRKAVPKEEGGAATVGGRESINTTDTLKRAAGNYALHCSSCHGQKGDGKGVLAGEFETPPRDHTDADILSARTDEELFEVISKGGAAMGFDEAMPPHNTVISEEEIRGLVKYIRMLCKCEYTGG